MQIQILSPEDVFTYEDGLILFGRDEHTLFIEHPVIITEENPATEKNMYAYYRGNIEDYRNFYFWERKPYLEAEEDGVEYEYTQCYENDEFLYWVTDDPEHIEMLPGLLAAPSAWAWSIIEAVSTPIGYRDDTGKIR